MATFHQPNPNSTLTEAEHSGSDLSSAGGPEEEACIACTRVARRRARLACGHHWCRRCLRANVRNAVGGGEGAWPPRCCAEAGDGGIGEAVVEWLGDPRLREAYRARRNELEVDIRERVYCHVLTCGAFIHPDHHRVVGDDRRRGGRVAVCQREGCGRETCVECRTLAHPGRVCPQDPDMEAVLQTIEAHGYQFCGRCGLVVERISGCNHMTCICGYEFCYLCGAKWKECQCPITGAVRAQQEDRPRLEDAARRVIDQGPPAVAAPEPMEAWRRRPGGPIVLRPIGAGPPPEWGGEGYHPGARGEPGRALVAPRPRREGQVPTWAELGFPYGEMEDTPENEVLRRNEAENQERDWERRQRWREGLRAAERMRQGGVDPGPLGQGGERGHVAFDYHWMGRGAMGNVPQPERGYQARPGVGGQFPLHHAEMPFWTQYNHLVLDRMAGVMPPETWGGGYGLGSGLVQPVHYHNRNTGRRWTIYHRLTGQPEFHTYGRY